MKNIVKSICLILFLGTALNISAQDHSKHLFGLVTNEHAEVLVGASVYWADTKVGATTDAAGHFHLETRPDTAQLQVRYPGYEAAEVSVYPGEDSIWIEVKGVKQLKEVTISEHNFDNRVSTLETRNIESISSKELRKAPCCNLSESFETNGTVDLVYSNAVTGVKEIQMLGLRGVYSQFMIENRPTMGGIATPFAFEMVPGTWLSSIQLAKGASTVKNGNAGISGQINAELIKPIIEDKKVFLNAFGSSEGRGELNVHLNRHKNEYNGNGLLMHGSFVKNRWDMNSDNFYDSPNRYQLNGLYRTFFGAENYEVQMNVQALTDRRTGGQIKEIQGEPSFFSIDQQNDRVEAWAKLGILNVGGKPYRQMGNMISTSWHRANSLLGPNTWQATQQSFYWQSLFETILGNTNHKIVLAPSIQYDDIRESVNEGRLDRKEGLYGAMAEYTYNHLNLKMGIPDWTVVLGFRTDYNSRFGWQLTPRMSAKHNFTENSIVRLSAGYGYRSPNLIAENVSLLASNRALEFSNDITNEAAWNMGLNFTQNVKIAGKSGNFSLDLYRTDFDRQVLVDVDQSPTTVYFYNVQGKSYANNLLVMFQYQIAKGLEAKIAYKYNDTRTTYADGSLRTPPLLAKHRGLVTLDYETPGKKWVFNSNIQIVGPQRLPDNSQIPHDYIHDFPEITPTYALFNLQITRRWKKFECYVGAENLTGYRNHHAIIAASEPWSPYFNASQIWAPMMGPIIQLGIRN